MTLIPPLNQPKNPPSSPTLAILALCGITLAFYHGLWRPGLVLIKRDAFWFHFPIKQYLIDRLASGELPQWFPYEALGRPFIGAAHSGVFHPFTALYFVFPVPDAYRVSVLLSCLLGAVGAFVLGRRLGLSQAGSVVAGVAFALSGYVVSLTDNIVYLYSTCVLPLFCAAYDTALKGAPIRTIFPAFLWASVFLNGDVQTGYYFGFIALLWTSMRAPGSLRQTVVTFALVGGLASVLAAIQLGPSAAVYLDSNRAQPAFFQEQALRWSVHPLRLLTVLASPVGGDADPHEVGRYFWGNPGFGVWAESLYMGIPVAGLAALGARHQRNMRVLTLLGLLALVLALGRYAGLYELLSHVVPFWSAFRYPEKFMGIVAFSAAMLAGAGVDELRRGREHPLPWFVGGILCAAAGLGLQTEAATAWVTASFGAPSSLVNEVAGSAALAFYSSAAAAIGVGMVVIGTRHAEVRDLILVVALVGLVTVDLARASFGAYHTGPVETATFVPPLAEALQAREGTLAPGKFRLVTINDDTIFLPARVQRKLGYEGAWSVHRRQALDLLHNASFHLESIYPYLPGYSPTLTGLLRQQFGNEAVARFNVQYLIGRRHWLAYPRLARGVIAELPDFDLALFTNPVPAKPRAYLSRRPERANGPVDLAALLARPDFLNGEVDVIEAADRSLPEPATDGRAEMEGYAPEKIRVRVETLRPGVLILLDAFDAGWRATLENGEEIPIMRANALVRAVVVPAGSHVVTFSYETPWLKHGTALSLLGVAVCLGLIMHHRWRKASFPNHR
jgi:hypothetical protein